MSRSTATRPILVVEHAATLSSLYAVRHALLKAQRVVSGNTDMHTSSSKDDK
jgi:hypothetical protein